MRILLGTACAGLVLSLCGPAFAVDVCPEGQVAVVRISTIKPGGTRAGFDKAVADHDKWYKDHGYTKDEQVIADILDIDHASGAAGVSKTQVMTIHYHATMVPKDKHDAAWDAFVAEYKANSDIANEWVVCLRKQK